MHGAIMLPAIFASEVRKIAEEQAVYLKATRNSKKSFEVIFDRCEIW